MKITRIREFKGAESKGSCNECLKGSADDPDMVRITFGELNEAKQSICLCSSCRLEMVKKILTLDGAI